MSLVGNLADLGLGEILQIVALSQKSGTLQLATATDSAAVSFTSGKVISVVREQSRVAVSDVLLEKRLASPVQLQEMMAMQKAQPNAAAAQPPLLWQAFGLDLEKVEEALRGQLEQLVYDLFEWDEGNFSFVVSDDLSQLMRVDLGSNRFCIGRGLNPQFLAIEGSRIKDERQRSDPFHGFMARSGPKPADATETELVLNEHDQEPSVEARAQEQTAGAPTEPSPVVEAPAAVAPKVTEPESPKPTVEPAPERTVAPPQAGKGSVVDLVLIDDDPNVLRVLSERLTPLARAVHTFSKVESGLKGIRELLWGGKKLVVVADLIIPRSDGTGILGGLEVLEKLRPDYPEVPIFLLTDYPNEDAKTRAEKLRASGFLGKPKRAEIERDKSGPALESMLSEVALAVRPCLDVTATAPGTVAPMATAATAPSMPIGADDPIAVVSSLLPSAQPPTPVPHSLVPDSRPSLPEPELVDLHAELIRDLGEDPLAAIAQAPQRGGEMLVLKSLLVELMNPSNKEAVTLLVLRYAGELFSRAVLFLVARDELWGLGGFSHKTGSLDFVRMVRRLKVAIEPGSAFADVLETKSALKRRLDQSDGDKALAMELALPAEQPVFIGPLVSGDRVAAILLGDNQQVGNDLGDTHGLEIFLLQAGMAMERTLLERRLKEFAKQHG